MQEKKRRTWTSVKAQLKDSAKRVFEKLKFEIDLPSEEGKLVTVTKEEKQFDDLLPDLVTKETQIKKREYFVVRFEDEPNSWDDAADIIVKIYETKVEGDTIRIEIFCSGAAPKRIYYKDKLKLNYRGLEPDKEPVVAAVMLQESKY